MVNSNNARTRITRSNGFDNFGSPRQMEHKQIALHSLDLKKIRNNRTESRHQTFFKAGPNNQTNRPKTGRTPHIDTYIPEQFRRLPNFGEQIQVDDGPKRESAFIYVQPLIFKTENAESIIHNFCYHPGSARTQWPSLHDLNNAFGRYPANRVQINTPELTQNFLLTMMKLTRSRASQGFTQFCSEHNFIPNSLRKHHPIWTQAAQSEKVLRAEHGLKTLIIEEERRIHGETSTSLMEKANQQWKALSAGIHPSMKVLVTQFTHEITYILGKSLYLKHRTKINRAVQRQAHICTPLPYLRLRFSKTNGNISSNCMPLHVVDKCSEAHGMVNPKAYEVWTPDDFDLEDQIGEVAKVADQLHQSTETSAPQTTSTSNSTQSQISTIPPGISWDTKYTFTETPVTPLKNPQEETPPPKESTPIPNIPDSFQIRWNLTRNDTPNPTVEPRSTPTLEEPPKMDTPNRKQTVEKQEGTLLYIGDNAKTWNNIFQNNPTPQQADLQYQNFKTLHPNMNIDEAQKLKYVYQISNKHAIPWLAKTKDLTFDLDVNTLRAVYATRYSENITNNQLYTPEQNPQHTLKTPFPNKAPKLPEAIPESIIDRDLNILRYEINKKAKKEVKKMEDQLKDQIELWKRTKKICKEHQLTVISTDKTHRNIIMDFEEYQKTGTKFLENNKGYHKTNRVHVTKVEKDANNLIKKVTQKAQLTPNEAHRLNQTDTTPANMKFLIKDHKPKDKDGQFPVRPIASVHNTPVNGIDFLIEQILTPATKSIKAEAQDALEIRNSIDILNQNTEPQNIHIASLDVVNLYPSIDTTFFIPLVVDFIFKYSNTEDTTQNNLRDRIGPELLTQLLQFICNNYFVKFDNQIYKQTTGVPMGARFAPPFAIICMHMVESVALNRMSRDPSYPKILLYKRYIDDILICIQETRDPQTTQDSTTSFKRIENMFNSINPNIQFTTELPNPNNELPFLDMKLTSHKNKILTQWYQKELHSGIILKPNAHLTQSTKANFLISRFTAVITRSNNDRGLEQQINYLRNQMILNGYTPNAVDRALKTAIHKYNQPTTPITPHLPETNQPQPNHIWTNTRKYMQKNPLKIPYITHKLNAHCKRVINYLDLPLKLINTKAQQANHIPNPQGPTKCITRCQICKILPPHNTCKETNVVYQAKCNICSQTYVGKTSTTLYKRITQHKSDLSNNKDKSPLGEHLDKQHPDTPKNLQQFQFSVLKKGNDPVDTLIREALLIKNNRPQINRREEIPQFI